MKVFPKNILLTGPRQIGKSTLAQKILANFSDKQLSGFFTQPILDGQICYQICDLVTGDSQIFARKISTQQKKFEIFSEVFNSFGREILAQALKIADLIVMDEIGVMEQTAVKFQQQIVACLAAETPVLAVVKAKPNSFLDQIKSRTDCMVIEVTADNRDDLVNQLTARFKTIFLATAN